MNEAKSADWYAGLSLLPLGSSFYGSETQPVQVNLKVSPPRANE